MAGMRVSRRLLSERMKAGRGWLRVEKLRAQVRRVRSRTKGSDKVNKKQKRNRTRRTVT